MIWVRSLRCLAVFSSRSLTCSICVWLLPSFFFFFFFFLILVWSPDLGFELYFCLIVPHHYRWLKKIMWNKKCFFFSSRGLFGKLSNVIYNRYFWYFCSYFMIMFPQTWINHACRLLVYLPWCLPCTDISIIMASCSLHINSRSRNAFVRTCKCTLIGGNAQTFTSTIMRVIFRSCVIISD